LPQIDTTQLNSGQLYQQLQNLPSEQLKELCYSILKTLGHDKSSPYKRFLKNVVILSGVFPREDLI
jgi:hypothetical protein